MRSSSRKTPHPSPLPAGEGADSGTSAKPLSRQRGRGFGKVSTGRERVLSPLPVYRLGRGLG